MSSLDQFLNNKLSARESSGLLRKLNVYPDLIDFCSNDYLGLSRSPELKQSIEEIYSDLPIRNGSTGSRLLSGNSKWHEETEKFLADIFQSESALYFQSGYAANIAVLSSLPQKGDTILYDESSHASIKDGARLSLANRFAFKHNDAADLERRIKSAHGKIFIAAESVYSMDGDECPISTFTAIAGQNDAHMVLDEAHSTGVFGKDGAGLTVDSGLHEKIPVRIYTFGKAMGIHGACVAGSASLIKYLVNFARPFIYTTAPDFHAIASVRAAFMHLAAHPELQQNLKERIRFFNHVSSDLQGKQNSNTAIQTIIIPGNDRVRQVSEQLRSQGFDARPILSPTVPKGAERIRICLHVFNSEEQISSLVKALRLLIND